MLRLRSIGISVAMFFSLFLFGMVLTPCVSAQLASDRHPAEHVDVSAYVTIDSIYYESGNGAVYLDGSYYLYNRDPNKGCTYDGSLRVEIFEADGTTLTPDAKNEIQGSLEKSTAHWSKTQFSIYDSVNIHIDCLSGGSEPDAEKRYKAEAIITLTVRQGGNTETWETPVYTYGFRHEPVTEVEQLVGIGPTTDGETFSDDCMVDWRSNHHDEGEDWQSLIYTDSPYDEIYWYVTNYAGTTIESGSSVGDGVETKATFVNDFPLGDGDTQSEGSYYEITAYVYRWDLTVYWTSYSVWVNDANGHD